MSRSKESVNRLGLLYSLVVVFLAIFLIFYAGIALKTELDTLRFLDAADARLPAAHILLEAELEVWEAAEFVLYDQTMVALGEQALRDVREGRSYSAFEGATLAFRQRYPFISEIFVSGGGRLVCSCGASEPAFHEQVLRLLSEQFPAQADSALNKIFSAPTSDSMEQVFFREVPGQQSPAALGIVVPLDQVIAELLHGTTVGPAALEAEPQSGTVEPKGTLPSRRGSGGIHFGGIFPGRVIFVPEELITEERAEIHSLIQSRIFSATLSLFLTGFGVFTVVRLIKAMKESEIKSTFLSGLSHDIRTPLSLVRLYTDTLLENPDLTDEEKEHSIEVIGSEVQRLDQLVNRLLTFSRISRQQFVLTPSPGDLSATIRRVLKNYDAFLKKNGFRLRVNLPDKLPLVRHDPTAISEALLNLLENSRKYSAVVKEIRVSVFENSAGVAIEVSDRGLGIAKSDKRRVFDEWFRGSHRNGTGAGLGLSIVKHIIEQHEGEIQLESAVGVGTTIRITLPAIKS